MNTWLPIFLNLKQKSVLLVGAGDIAMEKLPKLYESGALITVVATEFSKDIKEYIATRRDRIITKQRNARPEDFEKIFLVISAIDNGTLNTEFREWSHQHQTLFNAADQASHCDFFMTGTVKRGPLTIAISSEGRHPGLTRAVRKFLENILPVDHMESLESVTQLRAQLRQKLPDASERLAALRDLTSSIEKKYFSENIAKGSAQ
jgi:siroheme synthase-like protein